MPVVHVTDLGYRLSLNGTSPISLNVTATSEFKITISSARIQHIPLNLKLVNFLELMGVEVVKPIVDQVTISAL